MDGEWFHVDLWDNTPIITIALKYKDYGITWALTKEELKDESR